MKNKTHETHRFSKLDVEAVCFYTGVELQARKEGIKARAMFMEKYRANLMAEELFDLGERLKDTAVLLLSPQLKNLDEEIAPWLDSFTRQADSPVVKMPLKPKIARLIGIDHADVLYLAGLVQLPS